MCRSHINGDKQILWQQANHNSYTLQLLIQHYCQMFWYVDTLALTQQHPNNIPLPLSSHLIHTVLKCDSANPLQPTTIILGAISEWRVCDVAADHQSVVGPEKSTEVPWHANLAFNQSSTTADECFRFMTSDCYVLRTMMMMILQSKPQREEFLIRIVVTVMFGI